MLVFLGMSDHRFRLEILLTLTFQDKPMLSTEILIIHLIVEVKAIKQFG